MKEKVAYYEAMVEDVMMQNARYMLRYSKLD